MSARSLYYKGYRQGIQDQVYGNRRFWMPAHLASPEYRRGYLDGRWGKAFNEFDSPITGTLAVGGSTAFEREVRMAGQVTVRSFQLGDLKINVDGTEGLSLKQAMQAVGIEKQGDTYVINGTHRVPEGAAATTRLQAGDTVDVLNKARGGRIARIVVV